MVASRSMLARRRERLAGWRHEGAQGRSRGRVVMIYRRSRGRRVSRRGVELGLGGRSKAKGRVSRWSLRWHATRGCYDGARRAGRVEDVAWMSPLAIVVLAWVLEDRGSEVGLHRGGWECRARIRMCFVMPNWRWCRETDGSATGGRRGREQVKPKLNVTAIPCAPKRCPSETRTRLAVESGPHN